MGFEPKSFYFLLCIMVFLPALCSSKDIYVSSRATYYRSSDSMGTPTGACGFGKYGSTVYNGLVTAVSNKLYRGGIDCGVCYQVRCKIPELCSREGAEVVVTDHGEGDGTDFILNSKAYESMARRPKAASKLISYGVVEVEYQRVPCEYKGRNLAVKVHEYSRFPDYLAIILLYQSGKNDITSVELWQPINREWSSMRNAYGAVWDMPNPPKGVLTLRIKVNGSAGKKWVELVRVIPTKWKAGAVYATNVKLCCLQQMGVLTLK